MRRLAQFGSLPVVVTVLTAISALQLALVTIGNITDFGTNQAFVEHVFAMDTTFRSPNMMWRAVPSPTIATVAYVAVIVWEGLTAAALVTATVHWVRTLLGHATEGLSRRLSSLGWLMEIMLFGGGFIVIGGEWFQMWESTKWNGLQPALQNFLIGAAGLILAQLPASQPAEN
jgi:predicted small integral membrane protein